MGAAALANPVLSVESLLGGKQILRSRPRTALDWVSVIRKGISSAAVDSLAKTIHVTHSELAVALGIPERTLARRKKEGSLNSEESAKLVRLARVTENQLPANWRGLAAREHTQGIGTAWSKRKSSAVLAVPSAVIPAETNYLLNPLHPSFDKIRIGEPRNFITGLRLIRK